MSLVSRMHSSTPAFFDIIGTALIKELQQRRLSRAPIGLVVHLTSWEIPEPRFDVWPCPANPRGVWGTRARATARDTAGMRLVLNYVNVSASDVGPCASDDTGVGAGVDVFQRLDAGDMLMLELATVWHKIARVRNVTLDADYTLYAGAGSGARTSVYLTFVARFAQVAVALGHQNINVHLLDAPMSSPTRGSKKRKRAIVVDDDTEYVTTPEDAPKHKKNRRIDVSVSSSAEW